MSAQDAQPLHWHYPDLDDKNFELHGRSLAVLLIAFAILLVFSLMCLYIRWACRCQGRTGPQGTGPSAGPSGLGARQLSPLGLDPRVISSLPVVLHREAADHNKESMCSICLSVLVDGEKVKMLPRCRHAFHPECIDEWLRTRSSCPMCRACIGEVQRTEGDDGAV